jgi:3-dehydroquinate synthase
MADVVRIEDHLRALGLPSAIADIPGVRPSPEKLLEHMSQDKKVKDGKLTFILVRGLGRAFVTGDVPMAAVRAVLAA